MMKALGSARFHTSSTNISSSRTVLLLPHSRCVAVAVSRGSRQHDEKVHKELLSVSRRHIECRAVGTDPDADQEYFLQMQPSSPEELDCDSKWISGMIATWLDEEWTPLEVHRQLGEAAGAAYVTCRQQGDDDMSSLVLGLSNELLAFDYRDTFVNAFEVANKVVEMIMMRSGIDVCCTTDEDVQRMERFTAGTNPPDTVASATTDTTQQQQQS